MEPQLLDESVEVLQVHDGTETAWLSGSGSRGSRNPCPLALEGPPLLLPLLGVSTALGSEVAHEKGP